MSVEWTDVARDRLADVYVRLDLDGQRALVSQVERIEARLNSDPWFLGEFRGSDRLRVWCTGPLAVIYRLPPGGGVVVLYATGLKHGAVTDDDQ